MAFKTLFTLATAATMANALITGIRVPAKLSAGETFNATLVTDVETTEQQFEEVSAVFAITAPGEDRFPGALGTTVIREYELGPQFSNIADDITGIQMTVPENIAAGEALIGAVVFSLSQGQLNAPMLTKVNVTVTIGDEAGDGTEVESKKGVEVF
ncbi:uncharacterized protein CGCA056_v003490 [Neofusicoccum parvum]|uniref:Uncharacterized protein CGCA056_v003490 n=2 Tax=Neofusicoccum parvum TaxID=310453 RepID=A0ACB5SP75_9PEZI|nr:putative signal peptide-containing protein [Neofusicoccum parvum UCRNP2]GME50310.1 uncharacterized protein CGCA056_v003490 [Neofusicoccum parvum]GME60832.1 uncharacterized protein CGCA056_v003490 [Neofusicoccum parvum]